MSMEVVPIVDNKISSYYPWSTPEDFGAFAIDVINTTVSTSSVDIDITSPSK